MYLLKIRLTIYYGMVEKSLLIFVTLKIIHLLIIMHLIGSTHVALDLKCLERHYVWMMMLRRMR